MHQRRGQRPDSDGPENDRQFSQLAAQLSQQESPSVDALITAFVKKAWSSPKVKTGLVLWLIGMCFMTLMPPLVKVTPEMKSTYEEMAVQSTEQMFEYDDAVSELNVAQSILYESQVWFWRWRPEYKVIVDKNQEVVNIKQGKVDKFIAQRNEQQSNANAHVGIWSEYGMHEVKEKFWNSFEGGKVFAQRQTFWQMLHDLLTTRDEYFLSILFRWIFIALFNFTLALIGSLFYYSYTLVYMIFSYQTDPFSGIAFFLMSLLGGASIVATYLFGLYGMAAGGVYVVGKVVLKNVAIKYDREQRLLRERRQRQGLGDHES